MSLVLSFTVQAYPFVLFHDEQSLLRRTHGEAPKTRELLGASMHQADRAVPVLEQIAFTAFAIIRRAGLVCNKHLFCSLRFSLFYAHVHPHMLVGCFFCYYPAEVKGNILGNASPHQSD